MSLSIFIVMLTCWIFLASSEGSLLRSQNNPSTEDTSHHVLNLIVFIAFVVGLLWGFMNLQWYLVVFLLVVTSLVVYGVLLAINILTRYKDPHLYIIPFKNILNTIIVVCCIILWISF
jgi:hypothetical protein